jgi:transposase InsO family protein
VRYQFIRDHVGLFPVRALCRRLEVSPSGYYGWLSRTPSDRACENTSLLIHIRLAHQRSRERYGSPRIHQELQSAGVSCGRHRVARLMRKHGVQAKRKRRFRVTTRTKPGREWFRDELERIFSPERKDLQWAADITYLWTREGWMYLAVVMDLYSRRIVGWALEPYLTDDLTLQAMKAALGARRPPAGLIHHSDRGSQYASKEYLKLLRSHGIVSSMSEKGDCWDNAPVESFFSTLKKELGEVFKTRRQAKREVFDFIEVWYNRQRRHSTLQYVSPAEYESLRAQQSKA